MNFNVITVNISAEFLTPPGVPPWAERKQLLIEIFLEAQPTFLAIQEATSIQQTFLQAHLPHLTPLTVPVNNPDPALVVAWQAKYGKYGLPDVPNPYELMLFYNPAEFNCLSSGYWWLSPTPGRPSIGFGNVAPRAVLWGQFCQVETGQELVVLTTHIDHRCIEPMVDLCLERIRPLLLPTRPVIWLGDFNFNPTTPSYSLLSQQGWRDAHHCAITPAERTILYDLPHLMPSGRIDHIFYQGEGLTAQAWRTLASPHPEKRVSDHDPVWAHFVLG
jgi:endonuclease/exonuclease/phosphatase family metal-dependent hydrolase